METINEKQHIAHATTIYRNIRHTTLQKKKKSLLILSRPTIQHGKFLLKYKETQFVFGHNILTEDFFCNPNIH